MNGICELAKALLPDVIAIRRDIHQHPELGRQEYRTSNLVRQKLISYGVDELLSLTPTSVVAIINGKKAGNKCVALRADIDALPLQEETDLPYASKNSGVMHACGHDMHTAMLLGVAQILCRNRESFGGTVKLIFQHSEDTLPGGACELVEKGVLQKPAVDAIFGLHVVPGEGLPGTIGIRSGSMSSAVDIYDIEVQGKGGHSSSPHLACNPILAACEMISMLQRIHENTIDPAEMGVFPICRFNSGTAVNIIPENATFSGVARVLNNSLREVIKERILGIAKGIEAISNCRITVEHQAAYPGCYNDPKLAEFAKVAISNEMGSDIPVDIDHPMGFSEDFSYYTTLSDVPGLFMILYTGQGENYVPLHNPKCVLDDSALDVGISAMLSCAVRFLELP